MSTPYKAMQLGRKSVAIELNTQYYRDGLFYMKTMHEKLNMPTLFDVLEMQTV